MSRSRNIKPGFFKNDLLAECPPLARILFAGLWCEADREGRLEDRPKRIKAELLPYDDCDIDAMLDQLADRGFIVRYECNGIRYIAVTEFVKHQNPHVREPASQIPAPGKHCASTVQAGCENGSGPADSPFPFPDPPSQSESTGVDSSSAKADDPKPAKAAQMQERLKAVTDEAVEAFNAKLGKPTGLLPKVAIVTDVRRKEVKRCLQVAKAICKAMYGSERIDRQFWEDYWTAVDADDFHAGRLPGGKGHEGWSPDFEFLTRADVMSKLFDRAVSAAEGKS